LERAGETEIKEKREAPQRLFTQAHKVAAKANEGDVGKRSDRLFGIKGCVVYVSKEVFHRHQNRWQERRGKSGNEPAQKIPIRR